MTELAILLGLTLLNGLFSGAEIAVLSVRKTRLAELVDQDLPAAHALERLRQNPEGFLATVQIGITVVGATAAAFGGSTIADRVTPLIASIPALEPFAPGLSLASVVALVSILSIVLGELVPKSLALRASEPYALTIARPLETLAWLGRPLVRLLTALSNAVLRLFNDQTTFTEARLSREELQQIVEDATTTGSVDRHAGEIASRAIGFSDLDAYTVMVPRVEIITLPRDATITDLARLADRHGLDRVPIHEGTPENVIGVINLRDVLAAAAQGEPDPIGSHLRPARFVPDTMPAPRLLRLLQQERAHVAFVLDESGGISGLVTIDDLVEELVGDILGEDEVPDRAWVRDADGSWIVRGDAPIHATERELGIDLPDGEYATMAGLCLHVAGRIPEVGARLQPDDHVVLEILEAAPRRIKRVRVRVL